MKKVGDWCKEHWKEICLVIEIVAAVVCLLIPGLEGIGIGILAGMLIGGLSGAAIGGLSGYAQYGVDGILPGIINGTEDGMLIGGLFGGLGGIGAIAGEAFGCSALMTNVFSISSKLGLGMMAFDMTALANDFQNRFFQDTGINLGIIDPNIGEFISDLNHKAHSNPIYNAFQYAVAGTAAFSGGYVKTATCFVAGTLVATANGLAAIETIKAGDYVLSTDSDTMQTTYKPVLETYIRKVDRLVHLIISGEEIITTVDHPFYVQGRGFIEAGNLLVGDKLVSAIGEDLLIENYNIEETENLVDVYNFQVEDFHTYHVGDCAVWVHNAECKVSPSRREHILEGEGPNDPGHGPNRGFGNSAFPDTWTDDYAIKAVENVANSPNSTWQQSTGPGGGRNAPVTIGGPDVNAPLTTRNGRPVRFVVEGRNHGLDVRVIVEPGGEGIVTGFPINR